MSSNSSLVPRKHRLNEWSDGAVTDAGGKVAQSVSAAAQSLIGTAAGGGGGGGGGAKKGRSGLPQGGSKGGEGEGEKDSDEAKAQRQLANYKQQHTRQKRNVNVLIKKGITEPIQNDYMDTVFIVTAFSHNVDLTRVEPAACRIIGIAALNPSFMAPAVRTMYQYILTNYKKI